MTTPTPPNHDPLVDLAGLLFPRDELARNLLHQAFDQTVESKVAAVLAAQTETQHRARRVTTEVGAAEIGIAKEHLLRLARRGEVKREKIPGTRRLHFIMGDLLDWCKNNIRADGTLKHTTRTSAPAVKQKGR